jgi:hypothetical protein
MNEVSQSNIVNFNRVLIVCFSDNNLLTNEKD